MSMGELFPFLCGFILALAQVTTRHSLRPIYVLLLSVAFGILSSFVNGELHTSWLYAVVDFCIAGVASVASRAVLGKLYKAKHLT
jgi:hypothetical protein